MGKTHRASRSESKNKIIHEIRHGTLESVRSAVADVPDLWQDKDLLAHALYTSCELNDLDIVNYWLNDHKVNPNEPWDHGKTPLMVATSREVAEALKAKNADINAVDEKGRSALMQARSLDVAKFLIEKKAKLETKDELGNTALIKMLQSKNPTCIRVADLLISNHAKPNAADTQGRTALMTALWKNHANLVKRLIEKGAEVNQLDNRGRNALQHLCEDQSRATGYSHGDNAARDKEMLQALLAKDINIDKQDDIERKTALHYALYANNQLLAHSLLDHHRPPNVNIQDRAYKTALHIAAENGWYDLVDKLTRSQSELQIESKSAGGWRPLHFAALGTGDSAAAKIVRILLDRGARANETTDMGKTALHISAEAGNLKVVEQLLHERPTEDDVMKWDAFGNSAMVCAARAGHKKIVQKLGPYSTGVLSSISKEAMQETLTSVVDFELQEKDKPHRPIRRQRQVYDLIFGELRVSPTPEAPIYETNDAVPPPSGQPKLDVGSPPADQSQPEAVPPSTEQSQPDDIAGKNSQSQSTIAFRWVHLPANNVFWCRALLIKLLLEENGIDGETFQALLRSFDHQHQGQHLHARYMRPTCHYMQHASGTPVRQKPSFNDPRKDAKALKHLETFSSGYEQDLHGLDRRPNLHRSVHSQRRRRGQWGWQSQETAITVQANEPAETDEEQEPLAADVRSTAIQDPMYVFMPYMHFENFERKEMMRTAVSTIQKQKARRERAERLSGIERNYTMADAKSALKYAKKNLKRDASTDEKLIYAHATSKNANLQIRRTLDQFFYRTIDTRKRDRGQVVHRHQKRKLTADKAIEAEETENVSWWNKILTFSLADEDRGKDKDKDKTSDAKINIVMVDQLWMWIVSDDLVITSFPRRWGLESDDHGVWESIWRDINTTMLRNISNVYELATIISGHCFGWVDQRESWHEDTLFLDMFEVSIGRSMDEEVKLFKAFRKASKDASLWLSKIRGHSGHDITNKAADSPYFFDDGDPEVEVSSEEEPEIGAEKSGSKADRGKRRSKNANPESEQDFVRSLLDIGDETLLLEEVKDIRDELDILSMIYTTQKEIVPEMHKHILAIMKCRKATEAQRNRIEQLHQDRMRHIFNPLRDIRRMQEQVDGIYDSIRDLLDLKQKHANSIQATETQRQGKTLMVFTIVTATFLPLSFMAAFFAINVIQFPHNARGNQDMSIVYASKYIFGIGVPIAVVCIAIAVGAVRVEYGAKWVWHKAKNKVASKNTKDPNGKTGSNLSQMRHKANNIDIEKAAKSNSQPP